MQCVKATNIAASVHSKITFKMFIMVTKKKKRMCARNQHVAFSHLVPWFITTGSSMALHPKTPFSVTVPLHCERSSMQH